MAANINWSTPGIGFSEIDNSTIANTTVADGVGAIVLDADQGYVNQRILSTSRKKFHDQFGDPETSENYGHFAADQYLGTSPQLYAVRATMGDEGYGFIQFPYDDAAVNDCKVATLQQTYEYVDKEGNTQIKLLDPMMNNVEFASISGDDWKTFKGDGTTEKATEFSYTNTAFCLVDNGIDAFYSDLQTDQDPAIQIFRDDGKIYKPGTHTLKEDLPCGTYYKVATTADQVAKVFIKTPRANVAADNKAYVFSSMQDYSTAQKAQEIINAGAIVVETTNTNKNDTSLSAFSVSINKNITLNDMSENFGFETFFSASMTTGTPTPVTVDGNTVNAFTASITGNNGLFAKIGSAYSLETSGVAKIQPFDWQLESLTSPEIVYSAALTAATDVSGAQFREITGALYNQMLITKVSSETSANVYIDTKEDFYEPTTMSATYKDVLEKGFVVKDAMDLTGEELDFYKDIAYSTYGKDYTEVLTSAYKFMQVLDAQTNTVYDKIIFSNNPNDEDNTKSDGVFITDNIFTTYVDKDLSIDGKQVIKSAYIAHKPKAIIEPWQYDANTKDEVKKLIAYPSSEVLNDPSGLYKDGYTRTILTLDEPGNGDIERYQSNQRNQLVIAAVGPGEYGNNIGISIITPEVAGNTALENQPAAFDWKYSFDDEDVVDKDWAENPNYRTNPYNLTWKKVYKINVYLKTKNQQASVWGTGLDALVRTPVESFLVSNDPQVKDGNGNSMYAPYVINGVSKYIYVSLNSVTDSRTAFGTYAMPKQTYSIYQLTGGANSKKHTISEKTAALELYRDRQKCKFDVIFNVEPIESFQSRQKYAQMQRRIAEIAADRGIDLGIIQVTSKAARTGYRALSEGKLFTFQNGSYIACYAGYDRYYDSYTASWVYLPKSVAAAVAYARCWMLGQPWFAPAGVARGTVDYSNGQLLKLSDPEIGQLYDANINTSRTCAGYGEILWTQKTALKKNSALNRINVRGLVNYIEKYLEQMLIPYLYQNNTTTTRSNIRNTVDSFLSTIMAQEGLIAKTVAVLPEPKDPHLVYVNIAIIPAESLEFIQVTTTINRNSGTITSTEG